MWIIRVDAMEAGTRNVCVFCFPLPLQDCLLSANSFTTAVDAHVGAHLFESCILQLKARGKCVVLVTNALQFLRHSTHIVVLKEGRVSEEGEYVCCVVKCTLCLCKFSLLTASIC